MAMTAIEKIQRHATRIRSGNAKVHPGQPHRISSAASPGDGVWQGDLGIELIESSAIPTDYEEVKRPKEADKQLVPGNTQGAKHCLDSIQGVRMFRPADWSKQYDGLDGPCLLLNEDRTICHPTHGDVTIPAGFAVRCRYQRDYDHILQRERRNAD